MIIDYDTLEKGGEIDADICIVGGGAAGITIAKRFLSSNIRVCLLESGGMQYQNDIQDLYKGDMTGFNDTFNLDRSRLRFFGGTTNHWGGICGPLDKSDFEVRDWVPYSGWPLQKSELDPYYIRAHKMLRLGAYEYDIEKISNKGNINPPVLADKLITRFFRLIQPTRFASEYHDLLSKSKNVHVYLHANVSKIETNEQINRVDSLNIETLNGKSGKVKARHFVLACGGIENARILLLSNSRQKAGLGNQNDLVGRFYSTHIHAITAIAITNELDKLANLYKGYHATGFRIKPILCPSYEAQRREKILNSSIAIDTTPDLDTRIEELDHAKQDALNDECKVNIVDNIKSISGFISEKDATSYKANIPKSNKPTRQIHFETRSEQSPNSNSRVLLSNKKDALNLNRVDLQWEITEFDKKTVRKTTELVGEEFGRLGLGRIQLQDWLVAEGNSWPKNYLTAYGHHLGTTRMAESEHQGVVDRNCRVHNLSNLYIAGGSVFPTAGYVNPTLTIVALSLRLADHLEEKTRGQIHLHND